MRTNFFPITFLILTFTSTALHPQNYKLSVESINIMNDIDKLDAYFQNLTENEKQAKGSGFKPYNRWKWFVEKRLDNAGNIPVGSRWNTFLEVSKKRKETSSAIRTSDAEWTSLGPAEGTANSAGRMLDIAFDPNNENIIWAGSASGGLWKSTNAGASWNPVDDNLPSLAVGCIVTHNSSSDIIYIGTGEGMFNIDAVYGVGVLKSTDGGITWNTTGLSRQQSEYGAINEMVMHPDNANILIAATRFGVYRTSDAGNTWTRTLDKYSTHEVVIDKVNPLLVYATAGYIWGSTDNGIYKSTDNGITWNVLTNGIPYNTEDIGRTSLAIHDSDPSVLYAGISGSLSYNNSKLYGFYKTTDGGNSWQQVITSPDNFYNNQGWYNNVLAVDPSNPAIVYCGGVYLYKSTNSGANWNTIGYNIHVDHHAIEFHPSDNSTIFIGNDGGMYKSTNSGVSFSILNDGLTTMQFYAMGSDPNNSSIVFGGTQDNGTNRISNSTWDHVMGGDGGECNVDYTNSNIVYAEVQNGNHRKSTDGGNTWNYINDGLTGTGPWVTPVEMDPANPDILFTISDENLYKTTNGGSSWQLLFDPAEELSTCIRVAPSNTSTIYVGGSEVLYRTTNSGGSWTNITHADFNSITSFTVHPADASLLYLVMSAYQEGKHIYKSTNGGDSWTSITNDFPNIPCNTIVIDPAVTDNVYAGTDLGVYLSTNSGASWSEWNTGLPNVVVDELDIHSSSRQIYAATHGRGMYVSSLLSGAGLYNLSGTVAYNRSGIPISNTAVSLYSGTDLVKTAVSGADGSYTISGISPGNYTLKTTKSEDWGGSLASDALEVALYEVNPGGIFLPDTLSWIAGWVTLLGTGPSSADALTILNRSVNKITQYTIDDWQFEEHSVTIAASDVNQNISGICAGDARSDYNPSSPAGLFLKR